ncbi:MAG: tripeptidase T [Ktedonobacteraceae bacterium]
MRVYLQKQLGKLGLTTSIDSVGNLIATLPGQGTPLLLNAHMDRVPPGLGHQPILRDGVLYSDGTTNLGADDAAGLSIILETLTRCIEQRLPHPPLVVVFTVQEETGMQGAAAFDPTSWNIHEGLVFDNAFEAGVIVSQGAMYIAFDIQIYGRTGHPGKDLTQTVNALDIFRQANYLNGSIANDQTRINIGRIVGGSARNAVPAHLMIQGELRSFEPADVRNRYLDQIRNGFEESAKRLGGHIEMNLDPHCSAYTIDEQEPLLQLYRSVLEQRGSHLQTRPTFIGSDTNVFRPHIQALTISTGVSREHSTEEYVPLMPLEQLVQDTIQILQIRARM